MTSERPVAFVLPNLPETHFVIWGGETAGAVLAINPYLEPVQIAALMKAARARVLVTLAATPDFDVVTMLAPALDGLPDLKIVALADASIYAPGAKPGSTRLLLSPLAGVEVVGLTEAMKAQPRDRLVFRPATSSDSACSYFGTGGTTGLPKIAVRTHENEIFDVLERFAADRVAPGEPHRVLRLAAFPRQRPARHRPSDLAPRRPRCARRRPKATAART